MKPLFLSLLLLTYSPGLIRAEEIGDRSETVTEALEATLNKKLKDITKDDLATLTELKLPHLHLRSFNENDFSDMPKLKKLQFRSLFHKKGKPNETIAFNGKVFAKLENLEELIITDDQLGLLQDDAFAGLTSLKILDLSDTTLLRLPKSLLSLPKIETIYYDGEGMSKADYATLKEKLGDKLKSSR
jgi:Leucine-rich repeat (LRR) protein